MSISKAVFAACLLLFSLSGLAQGNEPDSPSPQPGFQIGLQLGMGSYIPFKTGGARQGGRNQISQFYAESFERKPGFRFATSLIKEVKGPLSFVQELGIMQSTNSYIISFQGLSDVNNYTSGRGTAEINSTFLQSMTGLQLGSQGPLKLGIQLGLEISIRLAESTLGTIETGDPDLQDQGGFELFPIIVKDILTREAFAGIAGTVYAGYEFGKHEFRVQARGSTSRLSSQKGVLDSQTFPRVSSVSLAWLFRLH